MLYVSLLYAGISSIDGQHNTVDISCLVGSKEDCGCIKFAFFAVTLGGNNRVGICFERRSAESFLCEWCVEVSGTDCVNSNTVFTPLRVCRSIRDRLR